MATSSNSTTIQNSKNKTAEDKRKTYHLTPMAEGPLLDLAMRLNVSADALVDLAVRQFLPRMSGATPPEDLDAWSM